MEPKEAMKERKSNTPISDKEAEVIIGILGGMITLIFVAGIVYSILYLMW